MAEKNVTPNFPFRLSRNMVVLVAAAVVVGIALFTSAFVVDATEQSVILTFGKYSRTEGPGLHFRLPFSIEENFNVPTKVLTMDFGTPKATRDGGADEPEEAIMLTGDVNILDVQWSIQYRIEDPKAWLFNIDPRFKTKTLRDISQTAVNQAIGDRSVTDVIGGERESINAEAKTMMNALFAAYNVGIKVTLVQLGNVLPPAGPVQEAFKDVQNATQELEQKINEAQAQYNKVIPSAQGDAEKMKQQAEGYAIERTNNAKGDVARFLAVLTEYRKNPQVTRARLYYEMVDSVLKDSKGTDLVDKKLEGFLPMKSLGNTNPGAVK